MLKGQQQAQAKQNKKEGSTGPGFVRTRALLCLCASRRTEGLRLEPWVQRSESGSVSSPPPDPAWNQKSQPESLWIRERLGLGPVLEGMRVSASVS